jgi:hypothetical protein
VQGRMYSLMIVVQVLIRRLGQEGQD